MSDRHATEESSALPSRISKDEINQLPLVRFKGKIHLIRDPADLGGAARKLRAHDVIGFDVESRPTFRKGDNHPVALLQLATHDEAFIFQLRTIEDLGPIREILEDPKYAKSGVAIRDDIKKLGEKHPFQPENFVELGAWATKLGIVTTGLRSLTAILLGQRISKGAQLSNWERRDLTQGQLSYAATDAWVSREIHLAMQKVLQGREQCPSA
jgi:ribonuclease D